MSNLEKKIEIRSRFSPFHEVTREFAIGYLKSKTDNAMNLLLDVSWIKHWFRGLDDIDQLILDYLYEKAESDEKRFGWYKQYIGLEKSDFRIKKFNFKDV